MYRKIEFMMRHLLSIMKDRDPQAQARYISDPFKEAGRDCGSSHGYDIDEGDERGDG